MESYRLWYVRRGEQVQGPFPEGLICRHIVLGRIGAKDVLSVDRNAWHSLEELPALVQSARALIDIPAGAGNADPEWREERAKAALRWLDDRKSPDPRQAATPPVAPSERRSGRDRRTTPESVEHRVYREGRAAFESWSRAQRQRYGWSLAAVGAAVVLALGAVALLQPVNPVKVGLRIHRTDCSAAAARDVDWSGCDKDGDLLVGADLRGAILSGASFRNANLGYADLTRANLLGADLQGAQLNGTRLGHAVWIDGRVCAADSVGGCR